MSENEILDYKIFDADNHFYEPEDAFIRHADARVRKWLRWVEGAGGRRRHLVFGNEINPNIPNPTFDPVSKPGALHENFVNMEQGGREAFQQKNEGGAAQIAHPFQDTDTVPLSDSPEYQDRAERLKVMDAQGIERAFFFPTLGAACPMQIEKEPSLIYPIWRAYNDWMQEDWGFNHDNRIYSLPVIPLNNVKEAVKELERVIDMGAVGITMRGGPIAGRSPADPHFDPFWSLMNDAGILACYHTQVFNRMEAFKQDWYRPSEDDLGHHLTMQRAVYPQERPIMETLIALVLGNVFGRFPKLKVISCEFGSAWVPYLLHLLDHTDGMADRQITAWGERLTGRPSDIMKEHVWIAPFPEEKVSTLESYIGADRILMGSDWPHPEGNRNPIEFVRALEGLDDQAVRKVMRDNAMGLIAA